MTSESDKRTRRIIDNLIKNISDGNYYESHQAIRTVVTRYLANGLVEHASECLKSFIQSYKAESFEVEKKTLENATKSISLDYAPDSPLLNCCSLVLAAVNKKEGTQPSLDPMRTCLNHFFTKIYLRNYLF
ncbi:hypothetical protein AYI70_g2782 [Smittium culicis]|uniref:Uncharacterized protein n=1 Tax=Smittium culicis TaxID=133412 RepID=A0A1R1Y6L4_9FUNG|nr:hypothetical protein AYI70_g2782 [Smittium culicis]